MALPLQRTPPPNKISSDSDIPASIDQEIFNNTRKRRLPDSEEALMKTMDRFEERFERQVALWNDKVMEKISSCVTTAVKSAVNAALNNELSKITSSLTVINENISQQRTEILKLKKSATSTDSKMNDLEKCTNFLSDQQDQLSARLTAIENNTTKNPDFINKVSSLETKLAAMEQQARQCNFEISNLTERRGENLVNIVESIGSLIRQPIRAADIVSVHRVPHADKKTQRPKNIVVKLVTRVLRDNFIAAYRAAKGVDTGMLSIPGTPATIYVNEHLTLDNKRLFRQCREVAKHHQYKYVWIKHGIILARKTDTSPVIAIRTTQDIDRIK